MNATRQPPQIAAPTLCPTFEAQSKGIWSSLQKAYDFGLLRNEETITDDLLLAIQQAHQFEVSTWQFNSREEAKVGADWEWWLTNGQIWMGLLIQAKKLDPASHKYKYKYIKHLVGAAKKPQIDLLIQFAADMDVDPIYFFYNYSSSPIQNFNWACETHPPEKPLLGCTVALALAVKPLLAQGGAGLPKMSTISLPMSCLVCCPVLGEPDGSLPGIANGVVRVLRSLGDVVRAGPEEDRGSLRKRPPRYVEELLSVPPEERGALIRELRKQIGPVGTLVVIKQQTKPSS